MTVENRKPRIDIKKMGNWLTERCKTSECPFCKGTRWEAVNGADVTGNAIPYGDGKGDMYMVGYPVLILVCPTCHFLRNIALTPDVLEVVLEDEHRAAE